MSFTLQDEGGLTVLGIYVVASNATPQKIGDLRRRFDAMGGAGAIGARLDDAVFSVYCEYEGDFTGDYTVVIGCAVRADAKVPEAMKKVEIQAGRFAVFVPAGELPKSVFETWAEIWSTPLDRRYQADFDRYGVHGEVTVHVGVR